MENPHPHQSVSTRAEPVKIVTGMPFSQCILFLRAQPPWEQIKDKFSSFLSFLGGEYPT